MTPPLLNNFVMTFRFSGFICASHYLLSFAYSEAEMIVVWLFLCGGSVGLIRLHRHRYFSGTPYSYVACFLVLG